MARRAVFPFTAIVGQEKMKRALVLNAVNPQIGGVLIRGERGTGKSTASRALAALLPSLEVVVGSRYNLAPGQSVEGEHVDSSITEQRNTPFVDLPVSATEDRVVGTLDIEKAIQSGEKHFEPGVLASANRGILYVDEVNLLDDHVVDLLLDSAAMGVNIVEREGISFIHPAKFVLVGSMNPEEGDLRPQLLDRFAFSVTVAGLQDTGQRVAVMERRLQFEVDPDSFRDHWRSYETALSEQIQAARDIVSQVRYSRRDLAAIATLTTQYRVDGHRGDIVILRGAQANAALHGRMRINDEDIILAAELALPHRARGHGFQDAGVATHELESALNQMPDEYDEQDAESDEQQEGTVEADNEQEKKKPWTLKAR